MKSPHEHEEGNGRKRVRWIRRCREQSRRECLLFGTAPVALTPVALQLAFTLPVNRSFLIETSTTLGQWTPWDVPGNQGLPVAGDPITLPVPIIDPKQFFRVKLKEN